LIAGKRANERRTAMQGYRKLGRPTAHRKAMLRNIVTDLLREGRISTTNFRAKEARREAEKLLRDGEEELRLRLETLCNWDR
jgi:ribosomal protein L17